MNNLTFITGNPGKARHLADYFNIPVAYHKLDQPEIQSLDLREIVEDKARRAYGVIQAPVLVEDISLVFNGLGLLPGPLIKWFYESLGNDGLCKLLDKFSDRRATASVMFAYGDDTGIYTFSANRAGAIAESPRGEAAFGWDPIFIPEGFKNTWAEMSDEEKRQSSMRRIALGELKEFIINNNKL